MICPDCRAEYRDGYYICRDCGVDLIPDLPPQTAMPPRHHPQPVEYTPLLSVASRYGYETVRAHLEAAGIEYIPRPDVIGRLTYPIKIEVRKDQDGLACDLLAELDLSLVDPFQAHEVPESEEAPGWTHLALDVLEEPAVRRDVQPLVGLEIEAAVARDGRYLVIGAGEATDSGVSLPGCLVAPTDETGDTLEGTLRRLLSDRYGIEAGGELLYVGSMFGADRTGRATAKITFLARWQGGEGKEAAGSWQYASDLDWLPGISPDLSAVVRRADGLRLARGW